MRDLSSLRLPAVTLVLALGACSGGGNFPSLAQRPAELAFAQSTAAAPAPAAPGTPDAAMLRRIAALRADAETANANFTRRAEEADHLAAAAHGTAVGSEAWAAATTALGGLDSARSDISLVLANLDALRNSTAVSSAQGNTPADQATYTAVAEADSAVAAMVAQEDARIAALHKMVEN